MGLGIARSLVVFQLLLLPAQAVALRAIRATGTMNSASPRARAKIQADLESMPGQHLVIVRYSGAYTTDREWVFNEADIDHARVVWAREINGVDLSPLLSYFRGHKVWLVEPDLSSPPKLSLYTTMARDPEPVNDDFAGR